MARQGLVQVVQQELAFAEAVSTRFAPGSALGPARAAAEESYAKALVAIGNQFNNSKATAIAAESYMNLSPWSYYNEVLMPALQCNSLHLLTDCGKAC